MSKLLQREDGKLVYEMTQTDYLEGDDYPKDWKVFAMINTIDYNGNKSPFGVIVVAVENTAALNMYGWGDSEQESIEIAQMEIGETSTSEDYGNTALLIRLA